MRMAIPALLAGLIVGCSNDPYKVAPISGKIQLNGKPLANASVTFAPLASGGNIEPGPSSSGRTDSDGRYTLTLIGKSGRGAVVGKHKVRIALMDEADTANDNPVKLKQLPLKYHGQTTLEFTVPSGGSKEADFDLTVP